MTLTRGTYALDTTINVNGQPIKNMVIWFDSPRVYLAGKHTSDSTSSFGLEIDYLVNREIQTIQTPIEGVVAAIERAEKIVSEVIDYLNTKYDNKFVNGSDTADNGYDPKTIEII